MTLDFVPIQSYSFYFYFAVMMLAVFTAMETAVIRLGTRSSFTYNHAMGYLVLFVLIAYMGLRPIDGVFVDMTSYHRTFEQIQYGNREASYKDPVFSAFIVLCTKLMNASQFFFLCAVIYIVPLYLVCKKYFQSYWFYAFLMLISCLSFWSYGVNGIRNGLATSIFLFGLSRDIRPHKWLWMALAVGFHQSMILPTAAYALTLTYSNPAQYRKLWLLCIPASLLAGGLFTGFFASLGFNDDRIAYLTDEVDSSQFSRTGFRWDFLIYSALPVLAGWYYTTVKKFNDPHYMQLLNIYMLTNALWILVIRANFSNRFAYLSWFMMGLILIYPLLKQKILVNQHIKIGLMISANALFTLIMVSR